MSERYHAVIVGGGLVGLALGVAAARQGLRIALVEKHRPPEVTPEAGRFAPRVSAINPHSRHWLSELAVWRHLPAGRVCRYPAMTVWDGQGSGRIHFDAAEVRVPELGQIVENHWLTQALWREADGLTHLDCHLGQTPDDWHQDEDGVSLTLSDGVSLRAGVLAACDGRFSGVRKAAGFATREWDYGQKALVTSIRHSAGHGHTARQVFLDSGPLALLPLTDESGTDQWSSIVWSADTGRAEILLALDDAAFVDALNQASEGCLGRIEQADARHAFPLGQLHARHYHRGRIVLVGDAAHAIHPLAGQGVNLGFRDAEVLAGEWGRASRLELSPGDPAVLRRFQRRRQSHNLAAMAAMEGFKRLFGSDHPAPVLARNLGLNGVDRSRLLKTPLIRAALGDP